MSFTGRRSTATAPPTLEAYDGASPSQPNPFGLHRLIYTSEALSPGSKSDAPTMSAQEIAKASGSKNATRGLSGILISVQNHFIQVLEGEAAELEATFESICRDMRHRDLRLIDFCPAAERYFHGWEMVPLDAKFVDDPESLEDFFLAIRSGMAPASILLKVREFLDESGFVT